MIIEIEKKYELTDNDYKIIKSKCNFISEKIVIDEYLDTKDYDIFKTWNKVRIRNNKPELKIRQSSKNDKYSKYIEIDDLEKIKIELKKMWLKYWNLEKVLKVETKREKYEIKYNWYNIYIDIDRFKYWERYEIEITLNDDSWIDASKIIDDLRIYLWLIWEQNMWIWKIWICAQNENKELYEIILNLF